MSNFLDEIITGYPAFGAAPNSYPKKETLRKISEMDFVGMPLDDVVNKFVTESIKCGERIDEHNVITCEYCTVKMEIHPISYSGGCYNQLRQGAFFWSLDVVYAGKDGTDSRNVVEQIYVSMAERVVPHSKIKRRDDIPAEAWSEKRSDELCGVARQRAQDDVYTWPEERPTPVYQ